jgi:hypothetical protein
MVSTGHFRRMSEQSPLILKPAPQAAPRVDVADRRLGGKGLEPVREIGQNSPMPMPLLGMTLAWTSLGNDMAGGAA